MLVANPMLRDWGKKTGLCFLRIRPLRASQINLLEDKLVRFSRYQRYFMSFCHMNWNCLHKLLAKVLSILPNSSVAVFSQSLFLHWQSRSKLTKYFRQKWTLFQFNLDQPQLSEKVSLREGSQCLKTSRVCDVQGILNKWRAAHTGTSWKTQPVWRSEVQHQPYLWVQCSSCTVQQGFPVTQFNWLCHVGQDFNTFIQSFLEWLWNDGGVDSCGEYKKAVRHSCFQTNGFYRVFLTLSFDFKITDSHVRINWRHLSKMHSSWVYGLRYYFPLLKARRKAIMFLIISPHRQA